MSKDETSFSIEVPNSASQFDGSITSVESQPITFSWKDLTIKVKGTEARNGICGIGKRDSKAEKYILQNGNFSKNLQSLLVNIKSQQDTKKTSHVVLGRHFQNFKNSYGLTDLKIPPYIFWKCIPPGSFLCLLLRLDVKYLLK